MNVRDGGLDYQLQTPFVKSLRVSTGIGFRATLEYSKSVYPASLAHYSSIFVF